VTETNVFQLAQPARSPIRSGSFAPRRACAADAGGREIMTGIGAVAVRQPSVRDRQAGSGDGERIRFAPTRRRLRGYNQLPKVVQSVKFNDGIEVVRPQAQAAA
jgi:hypothetical protein